MIRTRVRKPAPVVIPRGHRLCSVCRKNYVARLVRCCFRCSGTSADLDALVAKGSKKELG